MRFKKRLLSAVITLVLVFAMGLEGSVGASVVYLPDVTKEMTDATYWTDKLAKPKDVLADRGTIDGINAAGIATSSTKLQDLKNESETADFYTAAQQTTLKKGADSELTGSFIGKCRDENGVVLTRAAADSILDNYYTDGTVPAINSKFAIVTRHTTMRAFPTDMMLGFTKGDNDDDNLYLAALRVNEPLVVRTVSRDGKFMLCKSSFMEPAWVPTEDIAICKDKNEWLSAWDIPAGKELVVVGYKVRTEKTRVLPNTSDRMLYMGTVLERAEVEEAKAIVGTRSAYYNHVCYLPVRDLATGNYSKEMGLIAQSSDVNEGFLPLTGENIAKTAFKSLGQMYGWGGMLDANDCSGYVRDIYKCFGLELPRNTTWQQNMPVCRYDLSGLDDGAKAAVIESLPLGTVLFFKGHEMMYLGQDKGKLYVISALGSIGNIYGTSGTLQVKSVAINTLDMIRGNRSTWLSNLTTANIPYLTADSSEADLFNISDKTVTLSADSFAYNGKVQKPKVLSIGHRTLREGTDYKVKWSNASSKKVGKYTLTITGKGFYKGQIKASYSIVKGDNPLKVEARKVSLTAASLKKGSKTVEITKAISFKKKGKGTLKYAKLSGNKSISLNKNSGMITVKKGLKKGTYPVRISVKAAGDKNYKAATRKVTFNIIVK